MEQLRRRVTRAGVKVTPGPLSVTTQPDDIHNLRGRMRTPSRMMSLNTNLLRNFEDSNPVNLGNLTLKAPTSAPGKLHHPKGFFNTSTPSSPSSAATSKNGSSPKGGFDASTNASTKTFESESDVTSNGSTRFRPENLPFRVKQFGGKVKIIYEEEHLSKYVIPWNSRFRRCWDVVVVLAVLYLSFKIPIQMAFVDWQFPTSLDTLINLFFYTDIVLNFFTGFIHSGEHVTDHKEIFQHYFYSWFFIDVVASFPFEQVISISKTSRKSIKMLKWLKFPKLLRIRSLIFYLKRYVKYYNSVVLTCSMIFLIHLVGCFWISIVDPCYNENRISYVDPCYKDDLNIECCTPEEMGNYYITSLYIAVLMIFTIQDTTEYTALKQRGMMTSQNRSLAINLANEKSNETFSMNSEENQVGYSMQFWGPWSIFNTAKDSDMIFLYLLGFFATFVGFLIIIKIMGESVSFAMSNSRNYLEFYGKVDRMKQELDNLNIPHDLRYRVSRYYDYLWVNQKQGQGTTTNGILHDSDLSLSLRKEISLQLHGPLLHNLEMFKFASADCLFAISMRLRFHVYMPNDVIFREGDVARELYIIQRGLVTVYSDEQYRSENPENASRKSVKGVIVDMGPGSYFGEVSLILSTPRALSAKSKTMSELCELSKMDFQDCMDEFPSVYEEILTTVKVAYPNLKEEFEAIELNRGRISSFSRRGSGFKELGLANEELLPKSSVSEETEYSLAPINAAPKLAPLGNNKVEKQIALLENRLTRLEESNRRKLDRLNFQNQKILERLNRVIEAERIHRVK